MAISRVQLRKAFESGEGTTEERLKRAEAETAKAPARQKKIKTRSPKKKPDKAGLLELTKRRLKELWYGEKTYLSNRGKK